jgi:signal peptidase I
MKQIQRIVRENSGFLLLVVLMSLFRSVVADWNTVPTGSMKPTILEGDRILVDKLAYDLRLPFTHLPLVELGEPERGEIVIFDSQKAGKRLVKRVVGLPGDVVAMRDNRLYLNGEWLDYRAAVAGAGHVDLREALDGAGHALRWQGEVSALSSFGPLTVPPDHYLVLGDNRDRSADSRVYGFVPRREIVGRSDTVVVSLDYDHYYLPRSERLWRSLD